MPSKIFISYSRRDTAQALKLVSSLREHGHEVWIDQTGIEAATVWSAEIVQSIKGCDIFVLLLSHSSTASHNVMKEVALGSELQKPILPIELEPVELPDALAYSLAGIHRVSVRDFDAIIRGIDRQSAGPSPVPGESSAPAPYGSSPHGMTARGMGGKRVVPRVAVFGVAAIVLIAAVYALMPSSKNGASRVLPPAGKRSIAVVPFALAGAAHPSSSGQVAHADGFSEAVYADLSRISTVHVINSDVVAEYLAAGEPETQLAEELHAELLIKGSVQHAGGKVKVHAVLLDPAHQKEVWRGDYRGNETEVFDLQDSLSHDVLKALGIRATTTELAAVDERETEDSEAYAAVAEAHSLMQLKGKANLDRALRLLSEATRLDSNYALAHAMKSQVLSLLFMEHHVEGLAAATLSAAEAAVRLKPGLPQAHTALSLAYWTRGEIKRAIAEAERRVALAPEDEESYIALATVTSLTDPVRSATLLEKAITIEPADPRGYVELAGIYERLGETQKLKAVSDKGLPILAHFIKIHPESLHVQAAYARMLALRR